MRNKREPEKVAVLRMAVFGLAALAAIGLAIFGLVQNSQEAKERYETLIAVDKAGGDVEGALNELRGYIYSHMNTQIGSDLGVRPPIQLKGTYERLVDAEEARVTQANEPLYAEAQADCERRQPSGFSGSNRLDCIEAYVDANGEEPREIEDDLYKFDFASPRWSPDLAGFSILFAIIFGLIFLVDLFMYLRTRHLIRAGK